MGKPIDIFGDLTHIYDEDELPDEIINEDGKWVREKTEMGIGYSLREPSSAYLQKLKVLQDEVAKQRKEEEKMEKIQKKLREMAEKELEKGI